MPEWAQWTFGVGVLVMLYHIGTKLDEIADILRKRNSN